MPLHTQAISGERVPALDGFDALMLRCLAEHLMVSALVYAVAALALAAWAGKVALDAI